MAGKPLPPYHLGQQYAAALLQPVAANLGDLEARLAQFSARMPLSEPDRAAIAEAHGVVAQARARVAALAAERDQIAPRE